MRIQYGFLLDKAVLGKNILGVDKVVTGNLSKWTKWRLEIYLIFYSRFYLDEMNLGTQFTVIFYIYTTLHNGGAI